MSAPTLPDEPVSLEGKALETGASMIQDFAPVKQICAHLNAFHVYADDPTRCVEANHYCSHVNEDLRQCILYDGPGPSARLIGIEYMISARLYDTLDPAERRLWHSHVYEVRSGMLAMPGPTAWPARHAWDAAVTREMRQVVLLYGKVYHLWQTDRGDQLPLGEPQLMTSLVGPTPSFDFEARVGERDARLGTDWRRSKELRQDIEAPDVHPDADQAWKKRNGTE